MNIHTATVGQIAELMGEFASIEEANFMLADLFASGYGDTDEIPGDVWYTMVNSAKLEAAQYSEVQHR